MLATLERAAHLIGAHLEGVARELGITQAEAHVLVQLVRQGPMPIVALHHEFGTKPSTLTNVLDRLEGRRLVRRELNPKDRRSFTVHLTPAGASRGRRLARVLDELESVVRDALDERDVRGVQAAVEALASAIPFDC